LENVKLRKKVVELDATLNPQRLFPQPLAIEGIDDHIEESPEGPFKAKGAP
jgi:hypothetical protein